MAPLRFYQLDVFTDAPLNGNPLAVFPDGDGLTQERMQALAREMNLSETTFVQQSSQADARVRIFTPTAEIPLAGHPTIGTWWLLAELGRVPRAPTDGTVEVRQETGRGVLPVEVTFECGRPTGVVMTQSRPEFGDIVTDIDALARALGGDGATIEGFPAPEVVSTAMPQLMVRVSSEEALSRLPSGGRGAELIALLRRYRTDCAMLYVLDAQACRARCRMFAPGLGVPEDPATGSAAGALGAHLVRHRVLDPDNGVVSLTVEQGREIGRPSRIHVRVAADGTGQIAGVYVGGRAVRVIEGEVSL